MRFAEVVLIWMIVDKKFTISRIKAHKNLCRLLHFCRIHLEIICKRLVWSHCGHLAVKHLPVVTHLHLRIAADLSHIGSDMDCT